MKKIILVLVFILCLMSNVSLANSVNEDPVLINDIGKGLLTANHLPYARFVITDVPDTFDDYFVIANVYKRVEMFTWELSFANDKEELAAVIARQIGKISNNMPSISREKAKTNTIGLKDWDGHQIMSYSTKHIYSHEKLNKDKVSLAADRTGVDFLIQGGYNPLALLSVYGRYLDYDEDSATEHIMNIYDYINYNFPDKLKQGYNSATYQKALKVINAQLNSRTSEEKIKVQEKQAKIKQKKISQANSAFKGMNPWNASYTTLKLH